MRAVRVIWRDVGLNTKQGVSRGRSATRWKSEGGQQVDDGD